MCWARSLLRLWHLYAAPKSSSPTWGIYFVYRTWDLFTKLRTFILFVVAEAFYQALSIYVSRLKALHRTCVVISCVTLKGSSPPLEHLFHVLRLRLFIVLRVCILRAGPESSSLSSRHLCTTLRDSFPYSRHLFCLSCPRARHWALGIYVLRPGALHHARGILYITSRALHHVRAFVRCGWGLSPCSGDLLCLLRQKAFHWAQGIYMLRLRALYHAWDIYIMCCDWGSSPHLGILFIIIWVGPKYAWFLKIIRDQIIVTGASPPCVGCITLMESVEVF